MINECNLWIGFNVSFEHPDRIGLYWIKLGQHKWTHVQLCCMQFLRQRFSLRFPSAELSVLHLELKVAILLTKSSVLTS